MGTNLAADLLKFLELALKFESGLLLFVELLLQLGNISGAGHLADLRGRGLDLRNRVHHLRVDSWLLLLWNSLVLLLRHLVESDLDGGINVINIDGNFLILWLIHRNDTLKVSFVDSRFHRLGTALKRNSGL